MHSSTTSILCRWTLAALAISSVSTVDVHPKSPKFSPITIGQESDWQLVGQIGRKTYYTNNNVTNSAVSNWFGARSRCEAAGLRFADFQNSNEFSFVRSQFTQDGLYTTKLWVSAQLKGVDEFAERQNFVWGDGSNVASDISFHMPSQHWLCLLFSADDHLYVDTCLGGMYGTLCQFVL